MASHHPALSNELQFVQVASGAGTIISETFIKQLWVSWHQMGISLMEEEVGTMASLCPAFVGRFLALGNTGSLLPDVQAFLQRSSVAESVDIT